MGLMNFTDKQDHCRADFVAQNDQEVVFGSYGVGLYQDAIVVRFGHPE